MIARHGSDKCHTKLSNFDRIPVSWVLMSHRESQTTRLIRNRSNFQPQLCANFTTFESISETAAPLTVKLFDCRQELERDDSVHHQSWNDCVRLRTPRRGRRNFSFFLSFWVSLVKKGRHHVVSFTRCGQVRGY